MSDDETYRKAIVARLEKEMTALATLTVDGDSSMTIYRFELTSVDDIRRGLEKYLADLLPGLGLNARTVDIVEHMIQGYLNANLPVGVARPNVSVSSDIADHSIRVDLDFFEHPPAHMNCRCVDQVPSDRQVAMHVAMGELRAKHERGEPITQDDWAAWDLVSYCRRGYEDW